MTNPVRNITGLLPRDNDSQPIQVLAPGLVTNAAVSSASVATAVPAGAEVVEVGLSTDAWIVWGTASSTASNSTGMFAPKGAGTYRIPNGATHIAHIRDTEDGRISITRLS